MRSAKSAINARSARSFALRARVSRRSIPAFVRLEARGAVYLQATDGKRKEVCLTEQGKILAENTVDHVMRAENEIFESWKREEMEKYLALTERFLKELKQKGREMQ